MINSGSEEFPLKINDYQGEAHGKLWKQIVEGDSKGKLHSIIKEHILHVKKLKVYFGLKLNNKKLN
tara:strand:- start:1128 stop:1325 length:198 start_codon:yes stop_codon:yes gene_type:complete